MLESIFDLLDGLFLIAVIVLMVFSIAGSIVAALRAVSRGTATSTRSQEKFVDDVGDRSESLLDPKPLDLKPKVCRQPSQAEWARRKPDLAAEG